jgi:hypothetical protein
LPYTIQAVFKVVYGRYNKDLNIKVNLTLVRI